ncbi:MAG: amidase family protein [Elusimicrobia bacterium]|nr:amidase family protein [Elusimicrobiota bacterium]
MIRIYLLAALAAGPARAANARFDVMETSIAKIHESIAAGRLTCRGLVRLYLDRIEAYDQKGPALNSIITVNPRALEQAEDMDKVLRRGGRMKPLHCIPTVLKDNFDTADMPTTAGSAALAGSTPLQDAAAVARLKENGALILAKTNLHEFALAGMTLSSVSGQTKNPYDLTRTPGGSSGGTGAALAANLAAVGTGSDTMNSIRSPSSANSLVGIRPTRGLVSRTGLVPVSFTQDAAGPIARSVADAVRLLDAMKGYDPKDPPTAYSIAAIPEGSYTAFLKKGGLPGARLGVLRALFGSQPVHEEVNRVMDRALATLKKEGAVLVEVGDPALDTAALLAEMDVQKYEFKRDMNAYLQTLGPKAPVHSLADILASGKSLKVSEDFLKTAQGFENGTDEPDYKARRVKIDDLRLRLANLMAENRLDALVYPHQKRLAVLATEPSQADRNGILASLTGYPAITVPAGFSAAGPDAPIGVPVGIEFLGRAWSEPLLIRLAFGFEQAARARKPPLSTPALELTKSLR